MKNTLRRLAVLGALIGSIATYGAAQEQNNAIHYTGGYSVKNPCNNEIASGPIDIHIVVTTTQTGNGETKVNVHHNSHGDFTGTLGNEHRANRRAKGQFDAISNQYVIDWFGEFIGKGSAPNFTAFGKLRVNTNAQNEPVNSNLLIMNTSCQ